MNNKNYNNDHESFMEGIYGCMERIEVGIIELRKVQPNKGNSVANDENRMKLRNLSAMPQGLIADIQTANLKSRLRSSIQISVPLVRV